MLLNIALHGLEEAAGIRYQTGTYAGRVRNGCPALTRYADDLVVCCHSRQQAEQVKARLAGWLEPRGLAFNEAKTRIVSLSEGFDFLGYVERTVMPRSVPGCCWRQVGGPGARHNRRGRMVRVA